MTGETKMDETKILGANAAYYRAFRMGDDALMGRVWHDGAITCVHPGWPPIHGRAAVLAKRLAGPQRLWARKLVGDDGIEPPTSCV